MTIRNTKHIKTHLTVRSCVLTLKVVVVAVVLLPVAAIAQDFQSRTALQYRYESDPTVPTMPPPPFCDDAPFAANGYVEGQLSTYRTDPSGEVHVNKKKGIPHQSAGFARACLEIIDFTFTPHVTSVPIYWELNIDGFGTVIASGQCTPTNNTGPEPGVILGGCVMTVTSAPEGYLGGNIVESGVVFNPFGVPGYELSSSYFTIHLFAEQ
jgi:hypothetical protein